MKTDFTKQSFTDLCTNFFLFFRALLANSDYHTEKFKNELIKLLEISDSDFSNLALKIADDSNCYLDKHINSIFPKIEEITIINLSESKIIELGVVIGYAMGQFVKNQPVQSFNFYLENNLNFSKKCCLNLFNSMKKNLTERLNQIRQSQDDNEEMN